MLLLFLQQELFYRNATLENVSEFTRRYSQKIDTIEELDILPSKDFCQDYLK